MGLYSFSIFLMHSALSSKKTITIMKSNGDKRMVKFLLVRSEHASPQSGCFSAGKKAAYLIRLLKDNGDNVQLVTKSNVKT